MQLWRFLTPSAFSWLIRTGAYTAYDYITGAGPLPSRVRDYVEENARAGDPADVLRAMDAFARKRFLMNIGPDKGPLVRELLGRLPEKARILELGVFCGYSSIMFASTLGPHGQVVSIEKSRDAAEASRGNVDHAGLSDQVEVITGGSTETIQSLEGQFDLIFLDHRKDLYREDLELIEKCGLLRPGSIVVADNVGEIFGAGDYLEYVRTCGRYDSEHRTATIEYTKIPDAVEISVYRGPGAATSAGA